LRNVNVVRDLANHEVSAISAASVPANADIKSGQPLQVRRGIEVGHIFKLGTKYAEKFGATYTDDQKQTNLMVMGCYGLASAERCRR